MALGSTQPLTKMSTRNLPGGKKWPARRADNLAAIYEPMSENVGASTSRIPNGFHGLYRDNFNNNLYCGIMTPYIQKGSWFESLLGRRLLFAEVFLVFLSSSRQFPGLIRPYLHQSCHIVVCVA
jgi:hypothetical protein